MKLKIQFASAAVLIWLCLLSPKGVAQTTSDSTTIYRIEMNDGNEFIGAILSQSPDTIKLKTQKLGVLNILRADIKVMTEYDISRLKNGVLWFDNPQATRYLFAPNAYGLKPGEGYYQNVLLFVNQVSVGVTENFSIGAGIMPLFFFDGGPTPVWLIPKVSIPVIKDKLNIGGGALIGTVLGEEETSFGIAYGLTTLGSRDANITLGLGYGYTYYGWANSPTITFSGLLRTGSRGYLITENYFIGAGEESLSIISVGGRRIIKSVGLDFGLFLPISFDSNELYGFPFLGLTVPFGKNKVK